MLFIDTSSLIEWGGLLIIACFVFAETGLLLGLVVPGGETLLFTAGLLASSNSLKTSVVTLLLTMIIAGIAGDISGFYIGRKFKERLYKKKDTWYFKQKYLRMAEDFVSKHKKASLILGKFLPVIRPFSPVITGTTRLNFSVFFPLTVCAAVLYMSVFILGGYFLGSRFPQLENYLGWILPISILVALIPVIIQIRKRAGNY